MMSGQVRHKIQEFAMQNAAAERVDNSLKKRDRVGLRKKQNRPGEADRESGGAKMRLSM